MVPGFINSLFHKETEYANVIGSKEFEKRGRNALRYMSKIFSRTLGPYGMHSVLEDATLSHIVTKDGWTVFQQFCIYEKTARVVAKLVQKISNSLNETVGDGTTSAVIEANELYRLKKLIKKHRIAPKILMDIVKFVSHEYILPHIKLHAEPVFISCAQNGENEKSNTLDILSNIASISLNNNYSDGKLVAELFASLADPENGFINVEISPSTETRFDKNRGFEIHRGYIMPEMVNQPDGEYAIYNDPLILLVKGVLNTTDFDALEMVINYVFEVKKRPLVIIAGGFSGQLRDILRQSIISHAQEHNEIMKIACIEMDTDSSIGKDILLDIEANIASRIITVEQGRPFPMEKDFTKYGDYFGTCEKIIVNNIRTRVIGGKGDSAKLKFRIDDIDETISKYASFDHEDHTKEIRNLMRRKASLLNDMITLYVGGDTYEEKNARMHLFDDATRGCRSAIKNGIVPGGNTIVAKTCRIIGGKESVKWIAEDFRNKLQYGAAISQKEAEKIISTIFKEIETAYTRSYAIVLDNRFRNWRKSYSIAKKCVKENAVYNLVTGAYEKWYIDNDLETDLYSVKKEPGSPGPEFEWKHNKYDRRKHLSKMKVINSAETDTQILVAAISIVDLIITSNQFVRLPQKQKMIENI